MQLLYPALDVVSHDSLVIFCLRQPGRPLLLLSPGRLLLRREGGRKTTINFVQLGLSYPSLTEKCC